MLQRRNGGHSFGAHCERPHKLSLKTLEELLVSSNCAPCAPRRAPWRAPKTMCRQTFRNEVPAARTLALSCPLNRVSLARVLGHRIFSVVLRHSTLFFAARGSAVIVENPGAPCTLPRSSMGCFWSPGCKNQAAPDPSRRILPSDSRGSVTGIPAWSRERAIGKIACFPSSLVCTSSHPLARNSSA